MNKICLAWDRKDTKANQLQSPRIAPFNSFTNCRLPKIVIWICKIRSLYIVEFREFCKMRPQMKPLAGNGSLSGADSDMTWLLNRVLMLLLQQAKNAFDWKTNKLYAQKLLAFGNQNKYWFIQHWTILPLSGLRERRTSKHCVQLQLEPALELNLFPLKCAQFLTH